MIHMICLIGTSRVSTLSVSKDDSVTVKKTPEGVHKDVTEGQTDGRTDGSVTISLRNFVGEGIIKLTATIQLKYC